VQNKGDAQLSNMTLKDATASSPTPNTTNITLDTCGAQPTTVGQPFALNPNQMVCYKGWYYAGGADLMQIINGTGPGRYSFTDTASITGATPAFGVAPSCNGVTGCPTGGNAVAVPSPGPCLLCPAGTCPTGP
jgi:hypothetical protein